MPRVIFKDGFDFDFILFETVLSWRAAAVLAGELYFLYSTIRCTTMFHMIVFIVDNVHCFDQKSSVSDY